MYCFQDILINERSTLESELLVNDEEKDRSLIKRLRKWAVDFNVFHVVRSKVQPELSLHAIVNSKLFEELELTSRVNCDSRSIT